MGMGQKKEGGQTPEGRLIMVWMLERGDSLPELSKGSAPEGREGPTSVADAE